VSNNQIFDFLTSNSLFLSFVNRGSITNGEVYQGFRIDRKVEEHCSKDLCSQPLDNRSVVPQGCREPRLRNPVFKRKAQGCPTSILILH